MFDADSIIALAKRTPYTHLPGYMNRYWLKPFNKDDSVNIRVHEILSSDEERHMHDHPWDSTSIILKGGYWEVMPTHQHQHPVFDDVNFIRVWRKPGDVISRKATDRHRIEIPKGKSAWSMFIVGGQEQKWGFYTEEGLVYWRDYLKDYTSETSSDPLTQKGIS